MRRQHSGYRRLYGRCWAAHLDGDLTEPLELAADPPLSPGMAATIASAANGPWRPV